MPQSLAKDTINTFAPLWTLLLEAQKEPDHAGKMMVIYLNADTLHFLTRVSKLDPAFDAVAYGKDGQIAFVFDCKIQIEEKLQNNAIAVRPVDQPITAPLLDAVNDTGDEFRAWKMGVPMDGA